MKTLILFKFVFLCFLTNLYAQQSDSLSIERDTSFINTITEKDTLKKKKKFLRNFFNFKKDYPSPKKAAILSLVFPGAGQAYNKRYWKIPIVYAGIGALIYSINFNGAQYRRFRTAYKYRVDSDPCTVDEFINFSVTEAGLKSRRDLYHKRLELSYIGLVFIQVLSAVEAFTDAHLLSFDVNEDLTIQFDPTIQPSNYQFQTVGIGFNLNFNNKKIRKPIIGLIVE